MKTGSQSSFSALRRNPAALFLGLLVLAALAGLIVSIFLVQSRGDQDKQYLQQVAELRALAYQVVTYAPAATAGDEQAFVELESVIDDMTSTWNQLQGADESTREVLRSELAEYGEIWRQVRAQADTIIDNRDTIIFLNDVASTLNDSLPELQAEHNNIVEILLANNAPANQVEQAQLQVWRAERIGRNIDKMLQGGEDAESAADQFNTDASLFGKVVEGMKGGDVVMGISRVTDEEARESLDEITELFEFVSSSVREIFEATPALFAARQAADGILASSPQLLESLNTLNDRIVNLSAERQPNNQTIAILAGVFVLLIFGMMVTAFSGTRRSLREESETNERNQQAIMQLLDELADLADGDLTTSATVTEAFTGAIADSINYTIDQLRVLVSRINGTAQEVSGLSEETQQTALHLAEASEHQAQEIAGASAAVNEMAVTIDQVSANAAESAQVAERSVQIASNGAKVVQNTIKGMDNIREQIQDTSKRIKRLGESSQEIGDIVSLINDIADQTNILALNAAIQASMAGDAGRGFAVVADEVQRLAERSAGATKQIEGLVKAIQSDTNEAVTSMEQTTTEVVRGARLAQDAGVALEEIEGVSTNLAALIQNISNAARQQASSAGHISNTMNVIQEITSQTSAGTQATAQSIGNLAKTATALRESVAGFKLPAEDTGVETGDDLYDVDLPDVGEDDFPMLDGEEDDATAREDRALA
ncbi:MULTISPECIES: methyl-accepting chemotaxis protein [Microbulbifer]|uniref:methyl-accepting chemotaxis protein n=1 Tax=Microbulbifer TaxID=48073 RepID=UPI001E5E8313|nr:MULTISPECIES: methyl-accepting chemotaxis protein [Microbulbifer]UHQ54259.1 methyl-accepting chemotaxis protein [Microbulbifer sp. YPW16]